MIKKRLLIFLELILLFLFSNLMLVAVAAVGGSAPGAAGNVINDPVVVNRMPSVGQQLPNIDPSIRNVIRPEQLEDVDPEDLGDLGDYNIDTIKQYLRNQGWSVQEIEGTLAGANIYTVNGRPTLQLRDGTQIDLDSGTVIRIGLGDDGSLDSFEDDQGNLLIQLEGLIYTRDKFTVNKADRVKCQSTESHKVINLECFTGKLKVASAILVLIENGAVSCPDVKNSDFKIQAGKLIEAHVESGKEKNKCSFFNPPIIKIN